MSALSGDGVLPLAGTALADPIVRFFVMLSAALAVVRLPRRPESTAIAGHRRTAMDGSGSESHKLHTSTLHFCWTSDLSPATDRKRRRIRELSPQSQIFAAAKRSWTSQRTLCALGGQAVCRQIRDVVSDDCMWERVYGARGLSVQLVGNNLTHLRMSHVSQ